MLTAESPQSPGLDAGHGRHSSCPSGEVISHVAGEETQCLLSPVQDKPAEDGNLRSCKRKLRSDCLKVQPFWAGVWLSGRVLA